MINIQLPSFQPMRFIPSAQKVDMLNCDVLLLYAVGHDTLDEGGNHWCLYLDIGESKSGQKTT